jgi:hypothetical protein
LAITDVVVDAGVFHNVFGRFHGPLLRIGGKKRDGIDTC